MTVFADTEIRCVLAAIAFVLLVASVAGLVLRLRVRDDDKRATVAELNARIAGWWGMVIVFTAAILIGDIASYVLFAALSLLALREFVTLTPTGRGDHRSLFWVFFVITPSQYVLIGIGWYGMFSIMIPVYAFVFLAARSALAADPRNFLERTASVQWSLMICVYCVSYAPALLTLQRPGTDDSSSLAGAKLLLFLVIVVQAGDVFQYVVGKLFGTHRIAPAVSPNKTWEGLAGGFAASTGIGAGLWFLVPFGVFAAAALAALLALAGFLGDLVMSAVKRDRDVKDFGGIIPGHGGVLDRIDSLIFSAPLMFHLVRFFTPL